MERTPQTRRAQYGICLNTSYLTIQSIVTMNDRKIGKGIQETTDTAYNKDFKNKK
jgi:hypothetical protein